jgi:hypothetical protein
MCLINEGLEEKLNSHVIEPDGPGKSKTLMNHIERFISLYFVLY